MILGRIVVVLCSCCRMLAGSCGCLARRGLLTVRSICMRVGCMCVGFAVRLSFCSCIFRCSYHIGYSSVFSLHSSLLGTDPGNTHYYAQACPHTHPHNTPSSPHTYYTGTLPHMSYYQGTPTHQPDIPSHNNSENKNTMLYN